MHGSRIVPTVPLPSPSLCSAAWLTYPPSEPTSATAFTAPHTTFIQVPESFRPDLKITAWLASEPPHGATSWINYAPPINQLIWLESASSIVCVYSFPFRTLNFRDPSKLEKGSRVLKKLVSRFEAIETQTRKWIEQESFVEWMENASATSECLMEVLSMS